jgi:cephalosporin hydroxylase
MIVGELRTEHFGRYKLSNGQFLRSNEFALGNATDIIIHKNKSILDTYGRLFSTFTPSSVFELGVKEGGSLVLWSDLFDCKVVGLDIDIKQLTSEFFTYINGRDVTVVHADSIQLDIVNAALRRHFNGTIDLIIDDCSHTINRSKVNFRTHYSKVTVNGLYVIEDWKALHPTHVRELMLHIIHTADDQSHNSSIRKHPDMIVIRKMS